MLVTQQPTLKRFWYPVARSTDIQDRPHACRFFGEDVALWRLPDGRPAAVIDRCLHRTAKLSLGTVEGCEIRCPYHGWAYDRSGVCTRVPQLGGRQLGGRARLASFHAQEAHGYIWICAGEPLADIPHIPEAEERGMRRIHEFFAPWRASALRILENVFDMAHINVVHAGTFGLQGTEHPPQFNIQEFVGGFHMQTSFDVNNPEAQQQNLGIAGTRTVRTLDKTWYLPFGRRMRISYPNGLVHTIMNWATPLDDRTTRMVQFVYRNDTEDDAKTADIIEWDRRVTEEDRVVLESTAWDTPLRIDSECHMPSDRPGIIMRRRIAALLAAHGETEVTKMPGKFYVEPD